MSVSYTVHLRLEKQSSPTNGALAGGPTDASAMQPCLDLSDHDLTASPISPPPAYCGSPFTPFYSSSVPDPHNAVPDDWMFCAQ
ncbi:hypothetical protein K503DRAFT_805349 [Rhizopogon vinicolor AM-OR11-026]|uniref:Uncharacterized protein n=1 Tax=Rhizopogon vinicolor AM-OR11-026 TaxID=1314800 RepID=A0A1B7MI61_9AGAM|nr:hypothetical protein K503DRAFT_805349 [Rhizopogon vinicolor AM-OR11-026]